MTTPSTDHRGQAHQRQLLLWPGVVIVVLQWLARYVIPLGLPEASAFGIFSGFLGWLAILVWWVFFSRAPRVERWGGAVLMLVGLGATLLILHPSIATAMWGMIYVFYATPILSLAFVIWAVASRKLADGPRRVAMVVTILLACGGWALLRMDGMGFGVGVELAWRWSANSEERLLAAAPLVPTPLDARPTHPGEGDRLSAAVQDAAVQDAAVQNAEIQNVEPQDADEHADSVPPVAVDPAASPEAGSSAAPAEGLGAGESGWPGFLGPRRDGVVRGVSLDLDWSTSPPVELWKRPIGPGWSSFAILGDLLYTQEQRGEDEVVACYRASSGEPVWAHRDAARFWEAIGGAGPRSTPVVDGGVVFTLGGTGILNALDAFDGSLLWSHNAALDSGVETPYWGFAGSPLVVDDLLIVAASGALLAYDVADGTRRWLGPAGGVSYSSPQLSILDGVAQILLMNAEGLVSVRPQDGELLWRHDWPGEPILQPTLTEDGDLLISSGQNGGLRRLRVKRDDGDWKVEVLWTTTGMKPYYSEIMVHGGHAYGFDGNFLVAIDLADGSRVWKGGRYGAGQVLLLADAELLLVLTEKGKLAAVAASPDGFEEVASVQALAGKAWNHPALVGDVLWTRNAEEMAAFRLEVDRLAGDGGAR